jgi:SAM-dependent methyltransferase
MRERIRLDTASIDGYTKDGVGVWLGKIEKEHPLNIKTIDKINPLADYVFDFEVIDWQIKVDFMVMYSFIRTTHNPMRALAKALRTIKTGGYLIILDTVEVDGARHYFNFPEMEGMLNLYEDYTFIEARGITPDKKHYFYVCKKKDEVAEHGAHEEEVQSVQAE